MFDFITKSKRTHKPGRAALQGGLRRRSSKALSFHHSFIPYRGIMFMSS